MRSGCFVGHPVRGNRVHTRSAYRRTAPPPLSRWVDARSRIRPRERASRTRSPRYPPASASTARWDPSWLGELSSFATFRRRGPTPDHLEVVQGYERSPRCVRSTDAIHTKSTSTRVSFGDQTSTSLRPWTRCVSRFTAPHTLRQLTRAPLLGVFFPAMVPSSNSPLTLPSPTSRSLAISRQLDRWRFRANASGEVDQDRSSRPFVKKEQCSATRSAFHRPSTHDRDTLAGILVGPVSIPRLCHRDSTPDATSPGAVSRFELAPVHRMRLSARGFSGHGVVERLLQHDTKRGHTLRALRPSHVLTSRGQDTLSLRDTPFRACGRRAMRRFSCEGVRTGREPRVRGIQRRKERL